MPKAKELPPVELLRELLDYNPETGEVRWKVRLPNQPKDMVGKLAGTLHKRTGRWVVAINRSDYQLSRVAFVIYYGEGLLPDEEIDHINRNPLDNRITNLRKVDRSVNRFNRRKGRNNTSGHKGVHYREDRDKWVATYQHKSLGHYNTLEEALERRRQAEAEGGNIC